MIHVDQSKVRCNTEKIASRTFETIEIPELTVQGKDYQVGIQITNIALKICGRAMIFEPWMLL
jgi:hypothetical protein